MTTFEFGLVLVAAAVVVLIVGALLEAGAWLDRQEGEEREWDRRRAHWFNERDRLPIYGGIYDYEERGDFD